MISRNVTVTNSLGLHARPATFFIQKANSYKCSIWVEKEDCRVNAKSLLGILSLGISKDSAITVIADGADEEDAVNGLVELVESGFAELVQSQYRRSVFADRLIFYARVGAPMKSQSEALGRNRFGTMKSIKDG